MDDADLARQLMEVATLLSMVADRAETSKSIAYKRQADEYKQLALSLQPKRMKEQKEPNQEQEQPLAEPAPASASEKEKGSSTSTTDASRLTKLSSKVVETVDTKLTKEEFDYVRGLVSKGNKLNTGRITKLAMLQDEKLKEPKGPQAKCKLCGVLIEKGAWRKTIDASHRVHSCCAYVAVIQPF
jgi:hypothetical protein